MRFLIALYNRETAKKNLQFAALMASRLSTDITMLYVEPMLKKSLSQEMNMAREKLSEWHTQSEGYKVLRDAREHLASMGIINSDYREGEMRELITKSTDHFLQIPGLTDSINKITFRYREGESLDEILSEMREHHHEIIVIGSGDNTDFLTKLLKFSPSSVLIVKNPRDIRYKILVATDGTPPAHRAELLAIKTAAFLKMELTFLTVCDDDKKKDFLAKHLKRMSGVATMKKVKHQVIHSDNKNIVEAISKHADDDHIIFLGRSRRAPLAKLIFGSKTIKVVQSANCPLLLVK